MFLSWCGMRWMGVFEGVDKGPSERKMKEKAARPQQERKTLTHLLKIKDRDG